MTNATNDPRPDRLKINMAEHFDDHREEYERPDTYDIVYEDDEKVIVADHRHNEINEWALESDVDRDELSRFFHEAAEQFMGEREAHEWFSSADPIVFDKFE